MGEISGGNEVSLRLNFQNDFNSGNSVCRLLVQIKYITINYFLYTVTMKQFHDHQFDSDDMLIAAIAKGPNFIVPPPCAMKIKTILFCSNDKLVAV